MTRDFCRFKIKDRNRVPVVNLAPFPTDRSFRPSRQDRHRNLNQRTDQYFDIATTLSRTSKECRSRARSRNMENRG